MELHLVSFSSFSFSCAFFLACARACIDILVCHVLTQLTYLYLYLVPYLPIACAEASGVTTTAIRRWGTGCARPPLFLSYRPASTGVYMSARAPSWHLSSTRGRGSPTRDSEGGRWVTVDHEHEHWGGATALPDFISARTRVYWV